MDCKVGPRDIGWMSAETGQLPSVFVVNASLGLEERLSRLSKGASWLLDAILKLRVALTPF